MHDRVVIVTGGGTGIGQAAALRFAETGAWTVIVGRRSAPLEQTARLSDRIVALPADILRTDEIDRVVRQIAHCWGRIDALVNNAGAFAHGSLETIGAEAATSLFAVNVLGPTLMSQAVLPYLRKSHGSIVNVSSAFGHRAAPEIGHYAASKAAIEHLTRCWALELAPYRVRANAVAPGPTESEILARSGLPAEELDQLKREEASRNPLGRRGTPDDIAPWIVRLADSSANWVTGQVISIDGGLSVA